MITDATRKNDPEINDQVHHAGYRWTIRAVSYGGCRECKGKYYDLIRWVNGNEHWKYSIHESEVDRVSHYVSQNGSAYPVYERKEQRKLELVK